MGSVPQRNRENSIVEGGDDMSPWRSPSPWETTGIILGLLAWFFPRGGKPGKHRKGVKRYRRGKRKK